MWPNPQETGVLVKFTEEIFKVSLLNSDKSDKLFSVFGKQRFSIFGGYRKKYWPELSLEKIYLKNILQHVVRIV